MIWALPEEVVESRQTGTGGPGAARPPAAPTVLLSIPGMRQDLDYLPSSVVFDGPPASHRDPLQDRKTTAPRFFQFLGWDLFQSSSFEDTPRTSLPCRAFSRWPFRFSAAGRTRDPTARGGPGRDVSNPP